MPLNQGLRAARERAGLTQQQLADRASVTDAYIAQLETRAKSNPSLAVLRRLARALGVPLVTLGFPDMARRKKMTSAINQGLGTTTAGTPPTEAEYFLARRFGWMHRTMFRGLPVRPKTGDRGPVKDALLEIVDAAGALEYSRERLSRIMTIAQAEFERCSKGLDFLGASSWGGTNTPAVYYEFCNAVAWTRGVKGRYEEQLRQAIAHDPELWKELQKVRSRTAQREFEEARVLAKCSLHIFTPPYSNAGAQIEGGALIYPIPEIINPDDFRANRLVAGRHAASLVDQFWAATEKFVDELLDVFHPLTAKAS